MMSMSGGGGNGNGDDDSSSSRHLLATCCGPSVVTWDCSSAGVDAGVHLVTTPHGGAGDVDGAVTEVADVCWFGPRNGEVLASCCLGVSSSSSSTAGDVALIHAPTRKVMEVLRWPNHNISPQPSPGMSTSNSLRYRGATSISFGGGGRYASASYTDGTVSVWDLKRRKVARLFQVSSSDENGGGYCSRACFDPSSALIAALAGGGHRGSVLKLFRVRQEDMVAALAHPPGVGAAMSGSGWYGNSDFADDTGALCFSNLVPSHCAVGTGDGSIVVWDVNGAGGGGVMTTTTTPFSVLKGKHSAAVTDVAFSPVARPLLASSSSDGTASFHDVRTERAIQVIRPPPPPGAVAAATAVTCLSLHGDGVTCAVGTSAGRVHSYDLRRFNLLSHHHGGPSEPMSTLDVAEVAAGGSTTVMGRGAVAGVGSFTVRRIQFRDRGGDGSGGGGGGTGGVPSARKKGKEDEKRVAQRAVNGGGDVAGGDGHSAAASAGMASTPHSGDGDSMKMEETTKPRGPLEGEDGGQGRDRGGLDGDSMRVGDDVVRRSPASATTPGRRRPYGTDGSAANPAGAAAAGGIRKVEGSPAVPPPSYQRRSPRGREEQGQLRAEHDRHLPPPVMGADDSPGLGSTDGRGGGGGEVGRFATSPSARSDELTPMPVRPITTTSDMDGEGESKVASGTGGKPSAFVRALTTTSRTSRDVVDDTTPPKSPPPGGSLHHGERRRSPPTRNGDPHSGNFGEGTSSSERRSRSPGDDVGRSWRGGMGMATDVLTMDTTPAAGFVSDRDAGQLNGLPPSLRLRHGGVEEMQGQDLGGGSTVASTVGAPENTAFEGESGRRRGGAQNATSPRSSTTVADTGDALGDVEASRTMQHRRGTEASPSPHPDASRVDSVVSDSASHTPTRHTVASEGPVKGDNLNLDKLVLEHMVRDIVDELREDLSRSMRNMHVDMLRQFQAQSDELSELFSKQRDAIEELIMENEELRGENERLRSAY